MPYQPAVTPDSRPIGQGIAAAGNAIADGMESLRKQREQNEAADVTLEHLHTVSPDLLEPYLRKNGDTETPSAELLSKFLGNATRAKKEALIGATAGAAMMEARKKQLDYEGQRVGYEGQRIQQSDRQFDASLRADKTKFAVQTQQEIAARKERRKVDIVSMPDGSTMVVNGSGNFSFGAGARSNDFRAEPPDAKKIREEAARYGVTYTWNGTGLDPKRAAPQKWGYNAKGDLVPMTDEKPADPGVQPGGAQAPGQQPLPPMPPASAQQPPGMVRKHPTTGVRYRFIGGDPKSAASWRAIE